MITQVVKPFDRDEHNMKAAATNQKLDQDQDTSTMAKARFMISDILDAKPVREAPELYLPMMAAAMAACRPAARLLEETPKGVPEDADVKDFHSEG